MRAVFFGTMKRIWLPRASGQKSVRRIVNHEVNDLDLVRELEAFIDATAAHAGLGART